MNAPAFVQATIGVGLAAPQGSLKVFSGESRTHALADGLRRLPPEDEGWWSASRYEKDYRRTENWRGADTAVIDVDYHDADGQHAVMPPELVVKLEVATEHGDIPGSVFHATRRGFRLAFVLDETVTDPEVMRRALAGAAALTEEALAALGLGATSNGNGKVRGGLAVDWPASTDLARMFWRPVSDPFVLADATFSAAELAAHASQGNQVKEHRPPVNVAAVLEGVPDGERGESLFSTTCALRRAGVPLETAQKLILEAASNCTPPYPADKARYTVRRAYERYPEGQTKPGPVMRELVKPLDLAAVMTARPEPIPWVIEPLLAKGEGVVIAGESGIGKSWMTGDLTLSLAGGLAFLTILPVAGGPYRVMVVDLENSERLIRWRLRKLARGRGLTAEQMAAMPIAYHCQPSLDMGDDADRVALFSAVEAFRPDWVIVDSLVRCHRGDENSNSDMRDTFSQLARFKEYGAGFVVTHHLAKPSKERPADHVRYRIRGASDVLAAVDEAWGLQRQVDGFELVHEKTRWDRPAGNLTVSIEDVQDGEGVVLVAAESVRVVSDTVDRLLTAGGADGATRPLMLEEVMRAGGGMRAKADKGLSRELARLYAQKRVKKKGNKGGMRYWLTALAPEDAE